MTDFTENDSQSNIQPRYNQDTPVNNTFAVDNNASKSENLQDFINCAIAIRAAMAQLRLYPPQSATVKLALSDAISLLNELWVKSPELLITNNGTDIGVNGLGLPRQSSRMLSDMQRIMNDAGITAISYKAGITESEIEKFLILLGTYNSDINNTPFNDFIEQNRFNYIQVAMKGHAKSIAELNEAAVALGSGKSLSTGGQTSGSEANQNHENQYSVENLIELNRMNQADWEIYLKQYVNSAPLIRRKILAALAKWLDSHFEELSKEDAKRIDPFIIDVILHESDSNILAEAINILSHRMQDLIDDGTMSKALELIQPVKDKLSGHAELQGLQSDYSKVVDQLATNVNLLELAQKSSLSAEDFTHASKIIETLGEKSYKMIIDLLTNNNNIQDRAVLLEFIRSILPTHLPELYLELQKPQIWYVYRSLLEILNGYISEEQLSVISEKFDHPDYRVREQALITAVNAAGDNSPLFIMRGLKDENATVRARAASLISNNPQPDLLEYLIKILSGKSGRNETEEVLMSTCLSLRFFNSEEATDLLLKILHPPFLSPFRKISNEVRSVAVVALANSIGRPEVDAALQKASTDPNILVRQNAKQALAGK